MCWIHPILSDLSLFDFSFFLLSSIETPSSFNELRRRKCILRHQSVLEERRERPKKENDISKTDMGEGGEGGVIVSQTQREVVHSWHNFLWHLFHYLFIFWVRGGIGVLAFVARHCPTNFRGTFRIKSCKQSACILTLPSLGLSSQHELRKRKSPCVYKILIFKSACLSSLLQMQTLQAATQNTVYM